jgi:hypothetical protein
VGGKVFMMEPLVVAPKFWSFSSHIFSQVSQNVTVWVKVRVDCSVTRNNFMVNSPLHIKKNNEMLFVELWTCRTFFALGDCGLFHFDHCCFVSGS